MSQIVCSQLSEGVVPFLLCTSSRSTKEDFSTVNTFFDIYRHFGLKSLLTAQKGWGILTSSLVDCLRDSESLDDSRGHILSGVFVNPKDYEKLAPMIGILSPNSCETSHFQLCWQYVQSLSCEMFAQARDLYSSPYLSAEKQWATVWFLHGVVSFICTAMCPPQTLSESTTRWVHPADYTG
jgi:hypothetical protein